MSHAFPCLSCFTLWTAKSKLVSQPKIQLTAHAVMLVMFAAAVLGTVSLHPWSNGPTIFEVWYSISFNDWHDVTKTIKHCPSPKSASMTTNCRWLVSQRSPSGLSMRFIMPAMTYRVLRFINTRRGVFNRCRKNRSYGDLPFKVFSGCSKRYGWKMVLWMNRGHGEHEHEVVFSKETSMALSALCSPCQVRTHNLARSFLRRTSPGENFAGLMNNAKHWTPEGLQVESFKWSKVMRPRSC